MPFHIETEIKDGQLLIDKKRFLSAIKHMWQGKYLLMLISLENDRNEREWQKYYRVLLKQMAIDTGHDATEMHDFAKEEVLQPQMNLTSTTELNPTLWKEYIEHLADWALDKFDFII